MSGRALLYGARSARVRQPLLDRFARDCGEFAPVVSRRRQRADVDCVRAGRDQRASSTSCSIPGDAAAAPAAQPPTTTPGRQTMIRKVFTSTAIVASLIASSTAVAQTYPERPVRIVVPY